MGKKKDPSPHILELQSIRHLLAGEPLLDPFGDP